MSQEKEQTDLVYETEQMKENLSDVADILEGSIAESLSNIKSSVENIGIQLEKQNELHAESIQKQERVLFHLSRIADSIERLTEK